MQVSFWSNCEKSGVTSNLAATGVMLSLIYPCRIVLMEDHISLRNLGKILMGSDYESSLNRKAYPKVAERRVEFGVAQGGGFYSRETAMKRTELLEDSLYYITQYDFEKQGIENFDMYLRLSRAMSEAERNGEMLFVDAKSGFGLTSKIVLDASDLIVVNLKHDDFAIEDFIKNYSAILYKCIFIIGSYTSIPLMGKRDIALKYGLNEKRLAVIPYNADFAMAALKGRVAEFILENYKCRQHSANYGFIHDLKYVANMIMHNVLIAQRYCGGMANYI